MIIPTENSIIFRLVMVKGILVIMYGNYVGEFLNILLWKEMSWGCLIVETENIFIS